MNLYLLTRQDQLHLIKQPRIGAGSIVGDETTGPLAHLITRDLRIRYATCSDLKATYWMVGLALMGACVISFVWILLMRFLAGGKLLL